jgi:glycosyltransferase involved in cell wall biosynthesis
MTARAIQAEAAAAGRDPAHAPDASGLPRVSIVIPCRNEANFIEACLDSIIFNGYPGDLLEVLVVDGMSTDGTRNLAEAWRAKYPVVRVLDNPRGITPCALNLGIHAARGDVIMRVDAHATYEPGYVEFCVDALRRYGVDDTDGIWHVTARTGGVVSRAVVNVMTHRFGGAAAYRRGAGQPQLVNLVPFFCCRRETLAAAGPFNERLIRHQDFEYNVRLRRMGCRFMLVPKAICNYYARTDLKSFCRHSYRDGLWVILASHYSEVLPFSIRHLVPLFFVSALILGCIAAPFSTIAAYGLAAILALYRVGAFISAAQIAIREQTVLLLALTPCIFAARHLMFGLGSLAGCVRIVASRLHRIGLTRG